MADDNQALLLQVSADLSRLEKAWKKANGVVDDESGKMAKRAKKAAGEMESAVGEVDIGKAAQKVFDSSRLKVLDEGAAKVSVFGSALEDLGPAGIAGAAGIAAVFSAMAGAREAAKFADDIGDTAARLHVTTDALQEFRYAIRAAGGEEEGADEALEAFSVTLGKAQAGLAKSIKPFKELGFSRDQINGFKDAGDALDAITSKIAGLSSVQQDAVIDQLGLNGLKPLLEEGVDKMRELREEAHAVGIVMDAELVQRGGDLNDQFETISKVIDVQLKSSLVDLGPILLDLLKLVGGMARFAADVADSFRSIDSKSNRGLDRQKDILEGQLDNFDKIKASGRQLDASQRAAQMRDAAALAKVNMEMTTRAAAQANASSAGGYDDVLKKLLAADGGGATGGHRAAPRAEKPESPLAIYGRYGGVRGNYDWRYGGPQATPGVTPYTPTQITPVAGELPKIIDDTTFALHQMQDQLEEATTHGLADLNDGLADIIARGADAGDVLHYVVTQFAADIAKIGIQQAESGFAALWNASGLPSFAGGGYTGSGARAAGIDGHGGFLAIMHPKEHVYDTTQGLRNVGPLARPTPTYIGGPSFDLRGAVVTQDLLDQMNAISQQHAAGAYSAAVDTSRRSMPGWAAQNAYERG